MTEPALRFRRTLAAQAPPGRPYLTTGARRRPSDHQLRVLEHGGGRHAFALQSMRHCTAAHRQPDGRRLRAADARLQGGPRGGRHCEWSRRSLTFAAARPTTSFLAPGTEERAPSTTLRRFGSTTSTARTSPRVRRGDLAGDEGRRHRGHRRSSGVIADLALADVDGRDFAYRRRAVGDALSLSADEARRRRGGVLDHEVHRWAWTSIGGVVENRAIPRPAPSSADDEAVVLDGKGSTWWGTFRRVRVPQPRRRAASTLWRRCTVQRIPSTVLAPTALRMPVHVANAAACRRAPSSHRAWESSCRRSPHSPAVDERCRRATCRWAQVALASGGPKGGRELELAVHHTVEPRQAANVGDAVATGDRSRSHGTRRPTRR